MAHGPLTRAMEQVDSFRKRLNSLYDLCADVAAENGARIERSQTIQEPFSAQMSTGATAELPAMRMVKDRVEVSLRPSEITADPSGWYYAKLSVGRLMTGAGRLTSPSCWTDLDNPADTGWYAGAAGDKSRPVDASTIASWLHHTGPTPLY